MQKCKSPHKRTSKGKCEDLKPPHPAHKDKHTNIRRYRWTKTQPFCSPTHVVLLSHRGLHNKKPRFYIAEKRRWPSWFASNLPFLCHQWFSRCIFKTSCARTWWTVKKCIEHQSAAAAPGLAKEAGCGRNKETGAAKKRTGDRHKGW